MESSGWISDDQPPFGLSPDSGTTAIDLIRIILRAVVATDDEMEPISVFIQKLTVMNI
jgi:hypothetical protein